MLNMYMELHYNETENVPLRHHVTCWIGNHERNIVPQKVRDLFYNSYI